MSVDKIHKHSVITSIITSTRELSLLQQYNIVISRRLHMCNHTVYFWILDVFTLNNALSTIQINACMKSLLIFIAEY